MVQAEARGETGAMREGMVGEKGIVPERREWFRSTALIRIEPVDHRGRGLPGGFRRRADGGPAQGRDRRHQGGERRAAVGRVPYEAPSSFEHDADRRAWCVERSKAGLESAQ